MSDDNEVDQSNAQADGDITGRDKKTYVYNYRPSKLDELIHRLSEEVGGGPTGSDLDMLDYYETVIPEDEIIGLEAKLRHSGRSDDVFRALKEKEEFSKILDKWAHFPTAQRIFLLLLNKIEQRYNKVVYPTLGIVTGTAFDQATFLTVIEPLAAEVGDCPIEINEKELSGMLYWLAERCHIKWHK